MIESSHEHVFRIKEPNLKVCKCGATRRPRLLISKDSAPLVEEALASLLRDLWDERADKSRKGEATTSSNREIRMVTNALKELTYVKEQFGWE